MVAFAPSCGYSCSYEWSRLPGQGLIYYLSPLWPPGLFPYVSWNVQFIKFIHSFIHPSPRAHFVTLLSIHHITYPSIHLSIDPLAICPPTHPSIHPLSIHHIHPFTHPSATHAFTHPPTHSSIQQIFLSTNYSQPGSALGSEDGV